MAYKAIYWRDARKDYRLLCRI